MPTPTPPPNTRRRKGAAPLGSLVPGTVGPVFAKRGFAGADLVVAWPEIAGAGVARHCRPMMLQWPRHGAENGVGATLVVACAPVFALDLQQMGPVILERINQRLGWRAVARLTIKQMPVSPPQASQSRERPTPDDVARASRITAGIAADSLKAALTRLGAASYARARRAQSPSP